MVKCTTLWCTQSHTTDPMCGMQLVLRSTYNTLPSCSFELPHSIHTAANVTTPSIIHVVQSSMQLNNDMTALSSQSSCAVYSYRTAPSLPPRAPVHLYFVAQRTARDPAASASAFFAALAFSRTSCSARFLKMPESFGMIGGASTRSPKRAGAASSK